MANLKVWLAAIIQAFCHFQLCPVPLTDPKNI